MDIDIFKIQTDEEIYQLYSEFNKNLLKNNNLYFHFPHLTLLKYLKCPKNSLKSRFNKFKRNWQNFNNHKQLLYHFFKHNTLNYPDIFKNTERIIIDKIQLNYLSILEEINVFKINLQPIPYIYKEIIYKLIKTIINEQILSNKYQQTYLDINLEKNKIELELLDPLTNIEYKKEYKLNKLIIKYQKLNPHIYGSISAWLIVSKNWQDIFLSSTFKQWVSCMNLINTYKDSKIKYSNENYVKSRRINSLFSF